MFALIQPIVPVASQAFLDYYYGSVSLTRLEVDAIRTKQPLNTTNKREIAEWEEKMKRLGITDELVEAKGEAISPSTTEKVTINGNDTAH